MFERQANLQSNLQSEQMRVVCLSIAAWQDDDVFMKFAKHPSIVKYLACFTGPRIQVRGYVLLVYARSATPACKFARVGPMPCARTTAAVFYVHNMCFISCFSCNREQLQRYNAVYRLAEVDVKPQLDMYAELEFYHCCVC